MDEKERELNRAALTSASRPMRLLLSAEQIAELHDARVGMVRSVS